MFFFSLFVNGKLINSSHQYCLSALSSDHCKHVRYTTISVELSLMYCTAVSLTQTTRNACNEAQRKCARHLFEGISAATGSTSAQMMHHQEQRKTNFSDIVSAFKEPPGATSAEIAFHLITCSVTTQRQWGLNVNNKVEVTDIKRRIKKRTV